MTLLALLAACQDYNLTQICDAEDPSFDIEEVSSLEDAVGAGMVVADGVVLDYDLDALPTDGVWRVMNVDILLMVPQKRFDVFPDGKEMTVDVVMADDPTDPDALRWSLTQGANLDDLVWEEHVFTEPSAETSETDYFRAWWTFDFAAETSGQGTTEAQFFVDLQWTDATDSPQVGYSNYNNACDRNWTIYTDAEGWVNNAERPNGGGADATCSWPMFRVNTGVTWEAEEC
jgi:hypothetical protein